ncbi:hypothetical protein IW148_004799 [Coemansia sp. RSA 1199]|nr:hypothetical protein IW148_004799 [Coemansia sp. RSA 1199]
MLNIGVSVATMPTHTTDISATTSANSPIKVAIRIRPNGPHVAGASHIKYVGGSQCEVHHAFGPTANQSDVFNSAVAPLLAKFASGQSVAIMAYGQTGSGKTHTMGMGESPALGCDESSGVMPRALDWVFSRDPEKVTVQLVQLDNGKLNDLIAGEQHVASAAAALALLQTGLRRRHTAATNANAVPSRAHTVLTVTVLWPGQRKATKLRLADLAGSERLPAHGKVISASTSATTGFGPGKDDSPKTRLYCAETANTLGFVKWAGSVQNRKPSGIVAGGLGSAAEEAQKRIAAEAEAEQLRLQISAAARTVDAGTDTECKQVINAGTNFCGYTKPRKLVRKVCAPVSAQSAGMDTGKTGACIKPHKLVRKDWASAKPKSKVSLRARVCSALHI